MLTFYKLPKINDCLECGGTGIHQWFDLDGGPYYHWMKPNTEACKKCRGEEK